MLFVFLHNFCLFVKRIEDGTFWMWLLRTRTVLASNSGVCVALSTSARARC